MHVEHLIEILLADQFMVSGVKIAGGPIATLVEQELSKGHTHYPYTPSISTTPSISLSWFTPGKSSKGGNKGASTGSNSNSGPRSPFDVKERARGSTEGKGRR